MPGKTSILPGVKIHRNRCTLNIAVTGLEDLGVSAINMKGPLATFSTTDPYSLLVVLPTKGPVEHVQPIDVFNNVDLGLVRTDPNKRQATSLTDKFFVQELTFDHIDVSTKTPVYRAAKSFGFYAFNDFGKWKLIVGAVIVRGQAVEESVLV
jgi:hypothetical protein